MEILGCPVYKENSAEFSVEFYNLENFLSWNENVIWKWKEEKLEQRPLGYMHHVELKEMWLRPGIRADKSRESREEVLGRTLGE